MTPKKSGMAGLGGYRYSLSEGEIRDNLKLFEKYKTFPKVMKHATISSTSLYKCLNVVNTMIGCRNEEKSKREKTITEVLEKSKFYSKETRQKFENVAKSYDKQIIIEKSHNGITKEQKEQEIIKAVKKCNGVLVDARHEVPYSGYDISQVCKKYRIPLIKGVSRISSLFKIKLTIDNLQEQTTPNLPKQESIETILDQ